METSTTYGVARVGEVIYSSLHNSLYSNIGIVIGFAEGITEEIMRGVGASIGSRLGSFTEPFLTIIPGMIILGIIIWEQLRMIKRTKTIIARSYING